MTETEIAEIRASLEAKYKHTKATARECHRRGRIRRKEAKKLAVAKNPSLHPMALKNPSLHPMALKNRPACKNYNLDPKISAEA